MVDIKRGQTEKIASSNQLSKFFTSNSQYEGKLYIGYPILYTGGESVILDALWISSKYGIVIFDLIEGRSLTDRSNERDVLYNKLYSLLAPFNDLNKRRTLLVQINVVTYAPASSNSGLEETALNEGELQGIFDSYVQWPNSELYTKTL